MKFLSQINVNTEYTLPFVDGNNGQVLTTDGQGAVYWGNVSAGATSLDGLTDVEITSPQAGQILNYSVPLGGTVPVWRNITSPYATIASPAFTGIPTAPTAPTGTDSTQIATTAFVKAQGYLSSASSINDLSDVTISTATTGQILQWSGTQWVNATLSTVEYVSKVQHLVKCGVAVTKGQAVYVTTSDGTNMIVGLASNATEPTSSKVIGLAASTGAINDQIFVVTEGLIAGLNTSTANAGDPVWLGTGGNLIFGLLNKPVAPAHLVYLGVVTRVQQNNGEIFVNVQNGFELNELHDVLISSPSAGQLIRRDSDGLWKNWSPNFLTAEADTLQTVTTRGATTNLAISANGVTSPNFTSTALMIINADSSGSLLPDQGSPANKILSFRWQANEYGYIDTDGKVTLNGFKTPTGTASQFLKANGTVDSSTYLTTTSAASLYTTYDYVDAEISSVNTYVDNNFVPKTRTLTINGTSYDLSANRSWTITTADSTKVSKSGESHDTVEPNNLGAGDGGFYTVKNGFGPSGGNDALIHIPYSNSLWAHQLAFDWALGNDQDMWFRTKNNGTWQGWRKVWHDGNFTDNSTNWNTAYNDRITAAAVTGTSTKTLTLTQGDGGTVTATWTDYDTDNDAQVLTWTAPSKELEISNGNSITLDGLATEDYVLSQGFVTSVQNLAIQTIGGDSGAFNLDTVSGQHGFVRFSTGSWAGTNPYPGNYSHILSINQSTANGNRFVQMYLGDVPGALFWRMNQGGTIHPWERIWTAGNDGAASGLDADLLDGQHGSYYQPASTAITTGNIGSQSVTYATNSTRLYASDSPYRYGDQYPYSMDMRYDGVYWNLSVTPATPSAVRVAYSDSSGNADTVDSLHASSFLRSDIYNSNYGGLQVFRNIGTNTGSWPDADHTFGLENNDAGNIVVNFHRAGYTSNNLLYTGSSFRFDLALESTGVITASGGNSGQWNAAYNDRITAVAVSGAQTKTITLTQQDGGTLTATWTDFDSDTDQQELTWEQGTSTLSISNGNAVILSGFATEDYVLSQGFVTSAGTVAGVVRTVTGTNSAELVRGNMGDNDQARILVGATASNAGYLEIATADDGTEPIYVRQYTGTFTTEARTATLLDGSGNTTFPGTVTAGRYRGHNSIVLNNYTTVNPSSNVFLYSQPNDRDAWIFLDSADTGSNWGIYHRQIDSAVGDIPANSIGFVGGGSSTLQAYISLANGDAYFRGNLTIGGTFTENSSIRFKENIQPLEPALAKVEQLNPVTYTKITSQEEEIGLIAEEVAELFPEVVTYNEAGQPQGIQYQRLSVILLKAVQELTERVNKLENK